MLLLDHQNSIFFYLCLCRFPHLPCLHVGNPKRNVYIPMELCETVPGQRCMKKLNEEQTAAMIKMTAKRPHERMKAINDVVSKTNKTSSFIVFKLTS